MIDLLTILKEKWSNIEHPLLIHGGRELYFSEVIEQSVVDLGRIKSGDVVAIIGDFEPMSIATIISLVDKKVILVPLTQDTRMQHEYFFEAARVNYVIENNVVTKVAGRAPNKLLDKLRNQNHGGLVLFSSGTTGKPKAILHDFSKFLVRFEVPRPTLKTLNFLLFDHIGGLNTLFHTLFNTGTIIAPLNRNVDEILDLCVKHDVELLPTTPTFLRMMLISGLIPDGVPKALRIITYGTERMDQPTLNMLCQLLPNIDFRQTFGMSELGILRVKSQARDSLFMKIGGEGVRTRTADGVLEIYASNRMEGYLNAESPFDKDGWYHTKDIVEESDEYFKVTGRSSEIINVGGLKFMAADVETVVLEFPGVRFAKVVGKTNPITGEHVELTIEWDSPDVDMNQFKNYLADNLQPHMYPRRIKIGTVSIGHRFKKS